jgi:hypothetical protein
LKEGRYYNYMCGGNMGILFFEDKTMCVQWAFVCV